MAYESEYARLLARDKPRPVVDNYCYIGTGEAPCSWLWVWIESPELSANAHGEFFIHAEVVMVPFRYGHLGHARRINCGPVVLIERHSVDLVDSGPDANIA